MRTRRRLLAIVATLAIGFGALWPLVSAAAPRSREIPNFLCTQSGFQHPGAPASQDDKFHCPLCVTSMDSAPPALAPATALVLDMDAAPAITVDLSFLPFQSARSPPSRAPPRNS